MSKPPDLNGLAKQYLYLWQQQLGGVAEDDQAAEIMARTVELMNAGASTFAAMAATAQRYPTRSDEDANARSSESPRSFQSQQSDGSVVIPEVLRPYTGFDIIPAAKADI